MVVWLYCICKDEAPIMPYLLRHYSPWVTKLIFYDAASTDGTRGLIQECPNAELRDWPGGEGIVDDEFMDFANEVWKEAAGITDWMIFVDADEFLYHPEMTSLLQRYLGEGVEVPQIVGYTMLSATFPTTAGQIYDEVKTGVYDDIWSKSAIFRNRIRWNVGRHSIDTAYCNPKSSATAEIKLLHYRGLGMDYVDRRHRRNWARVPERCRQMNLGTNCNPDHAEHHSIAWFAQQIAANPPAVI